MALSTSRERLPAFAGHLRRHRLSRGLSQRAVADAAGIDHATLQRIERGYDQNNRLSTIQAIINALHDAQPFSAQELRELAESYLLGHSSALDAEPSGQLIAVILPTISGNTFWSSVVGAIERYVTTRGYRVLLCQYHANMQLQNNHLISLQSMPLLTGVIIAPSEATPTTELRREFHDALKGLLGRGVPVVFIDRLVPLPIRIPSITLRNQHAGYIGVRKLLSAGHRRIAIVIGTHYSVVQRDRLAGYRQALNEAGLDIDEDLIIADEAERAPGFIQDIASLRSKLEQCWKICKPTAVFSVSYPSTIDTVRALHELGIRIPKDVSFLGFNSVPELSVFEPTIAHVAFDLYEYARLALEKIEALKANPGDERALEDGVILSTHIVDGGSIKDATEEADRGLAEHL
jgi:LacI family transcriptional regulator